MAATHKGHCQICGRQHKVTSTLLATHGYTIRNGWQEGACFGSGAQPYELSNDRLLAGINNAKLYIDRIEALIGRLCADPLAEVDRDGKVLASVTQNYTRTSKMVRIVQAANGRIVGEVADGKVLRLSNDQAAQAKSVEAALRILADSRIEYLRSTIRQSNESIEYMQERFDNWNPAPLASISAAEKAASGPKVHFRTGRYGRMSTACSHSANAALRNSSLHSTDDPSAVTCASCVRDMAERAARAALKAQQAEQIDG